MKISNPIYSKSILTSEIGNDISMFLFLMSKCHFDVKNSSNIYNKTIYNINILDIYNKMIYNIKILDEYKNICHLISKYFFTNLDIK